MAVHPIIALWAHPRSMSTAMERLMRERGDLACFHEPFLYDYYINRQTRVMAHFDPEDGRPLTYEAVREMLLQAAEHGPVFIKDMSYYVMPRILEDAALAPRLINSFLVRDPVASIPSFYKLDPDLTLDEIGLEAQARHYQALKAAGGAPVVLRAEDIRADPRRVVTAFWQAIGLPPAPHAFDWQEGTPADWGHVGGWHGTVSASTGIRPLTDQERAAQQRRFEDVAAKRPDLRDMLAHHQSFYDMLKAEALKG